MIGKEYWLALDLRARRECLLRQEVMTMILRIASTMTLSLTRHRKLSLTLPSVSSTLTPTKTGKLIGTSIPLLPESMMRLSQMMNYSGAGSLAKSRVMRVTGSMSP